MWCVNVIAALLLTALVLLVIKWPDKNKLIGDELDTHIYIFNIYHLLTVTEDGENYVGKFNPNQYFDDRFCFKYDEESKAYSISTEYDDKTLYLAVTDDGEFELTENFSLAECMWRVVRNGNTMYYSIVNTASDCALLRLDDGRAFVMPYDENNTAMYLRFE